MCMHTHAAQLQTNTEWVCLEQILGKEPHLIMSVAQGEVISKVHGVQAISHYIALAPDDSNIYIHTHA